MASRSRSSSSSKLTSEMPSRGLISENSSLASVLSTGFRGLSSRVWNGLFYTCGSIVLCSTDSPLPPRISLIRCLRTLVSLWRMSLRILTSLSASSIIYLFFSILRTSSTRSRLALFIFFCFNSLISSTARRAILFWGSFAWLH